jgi:hypothetical protein
VARPLKARSPTEHTLTLTRVARSIERDESIPPLRRRLLLRLLARLITELQKGM